MKPSSKSPCPPMDCERRCTFSSAKPCRLPSQTRQCQLTGNRRVDVIKHNRSATLSRIAGMAGACLLAALVGRMDPVAAQTTGGTPDVPPPAGPTPRLPSGRPDLSGVWNPPYVPDMTRNGRRQQGYAETPFSPLDSPQARQSLRNKGDFAELPFTASGLENWKTYDAA